MTPENKAERDPRMSVCPECPLCHGVASFMKDLPGPYGQCHGCRAVFLDPGARLSAEDEKTRYLLHQNNIHDPGYQEFVRPVVEEVEKNFQPARHEGLDFGCGTGPVITHLLRDKGYALECYDPFFMDHPRALQRQYDFIVCCEVIEHFHFPDREFTLLKSLLKPGGALICMTHVYSPEIDFGSWYYKNDPTHVIFYQSETLEWIRIAFGFSSLKQDRRRVCFYF